MGPLLGAQCLVVGEISPTKDMIVVINKIVRGSEGVHGRWVLI